MNPWTFDLFLTGFVFRKHKLKLLFSC